MPEAAPSTQAIELAPRQREDATKLSRSEKPNRRYRIAFIGGRGVGGSYSGIETFYEEVGSRLVARGHDLTVYCRPHFTPGVDRYRGMRVRTVPAPRSKHLETLIHSGLSTVDALWRKFDIVHLHAIGSSVFALLPKLSGARSVVTVHALDWQRPKWSAAARLCLRFAEWTSVRFPSCTTAVSESVGDHLRRKYGKRVHVIRNGVAAKPRTPPSAVEALGILPRRFVLFVGRLSEEKRCHDLIEAFQRVRPAGMELVLAGGATYAAEYAQRLHAMASPAVRFLGWVDPISLGALYDHCALFVLPSSLEGFPVALLEAMANGAPVLVSDIGPNLEAIGDAGWSFHMGDVADLADSLTRLLTDPGALRTGGERARRRAEEEFGWDLVVTRFERVYDSLFDNQGATE
jgi:glycosyltransferase involved in cell wall biosynthesis